VRPHLLTLTAFGSFPATETVSFDALTDAGLFLVHGPTGAGKTTVLDALCFALFGKVASTQRDSARSLRCDHAPPGVGPSVTLEVTVRGRRLRIVRSPAWQRPKRRGTGVTEENAKVVVQEWAGSSWQGLTTRLDEAGDLIGGLLGMNVDQFCQVAMLPQGDFARFLQAGGEDRRRLLERLFTVKVFAQAEAWLVERRRLLGQQRQEQRQRVDFALQRVEEAAGELSSPAAPEREDDPLGWAGALLAAGRPSRAAAEERFLAADGELGRARTAHEAAAVLAGHRRRHAEARTLLRALDERAEERADLQAVLDDAARAATVLPLVTAARQRAETRSKTHLLALDALGRAACLLPAAATSAETLASVRREARDALPLSGPGTRVGAESSVRLEALERERRAELARLSELLTEEARLSVLRRDLGRVEQELTGLIAEDESTAARLADLPALIEVAEAQVADARLAAARIPAAQAVRATVADVLETDRELARLTARLAASAARHAEAEAAAEALPARLAGARARLTDVRALSAALPAAVAARDSARGVLEAARRRDALTGELATASGALTGLVDEAHRRREHWLDVRQARLDGMAAELARDLADGTPCAVCGSAVHPAPASPAPSAPSPDDERTAEAAHEAAAARRESAERDIATLESRLADAAGDSVAAASASVAEADAEVARLAEGAAREPAAAADVEAAEAERSQAADLVRTLGEELAAVRSQHRQLAAERSRLLTRLAARTSSGGTAGDATEDAGQAPARTTEQRAGRDAEPGAVEVGKDEPDAGGLGAGEPGVDEVGVDEVVGMLREAEADLDRLRRAAAREPGLVAEAERLAQERTEVVERVRSLAARVAAGRTRREELSGDVTRLTSRLDEARGEDGTLATRLSRLSDEAELLSEAIEATQQAITAEGEHEAAEEAAREAAEAAGFLDVEEAVAAVRAPAVLEEKGELLRELDARHAAVTSTLADPVLVAAAAEAAPDLEGLEQARELAEAEVTASASARDRARARAERLGALHEDLDGCLQRWRPVEEDYRLAERLAALTSGTSGDNQWNMSLSSFVLGERLRQVVEAANERLDHMSGGRYRLRHDLRKTAGTRSRSGGGLGLRVADGWTGVDRDPATLSGGESFITSLALALGLADVVTAEAGGAEVGTLFVDEGFGTLDEDTLDGVLDILDGLRDGGRAVGIVSHVAELRTRIPTQLRVVKTRSGSTLSVADGTGRR
jgi:DNA repair protein SbcC/Rad50